MACICVSHPTLVSARIQTPGALVIDLEPWEATDLAQRTG